MISSLLENKNKHVNSQIIITTHSPHILNSKIHEGNTFSNINYITTKGNVAQAVRLNDEAVLELPKRDDPDDFKKLYYQNLQFIKKHIKFKVSELFFADTVIFVEGITEYTLLQYYLDADISFNKYYISLILTDGAHAKVYEKLIHTLGIPTLIITDIDIKREKFEKYERDQEKNPGRKRCYLQMNSKALKGRSTTNSTLIHFYETSSAKNIIDGDYKIKNNLMVLCQKQKNKGFYPTSFEEAYILTNPENDIVNAALKKVKPDIYKDVKENGGIVKNSYKLQNKLSNSKSDFANEILFGILTSDDATKIPELPQYINDGLRFLKKRLGGETNEL
jgi:putative ATP-dependent endonuclease of OLD family